MRLMLGGSYPFDDDAMFFNLAHAASGASLAILPNLAAPA
jgi:hypothetical protein